MKLMVLTGSPNAKGTTDRLAEEFIRGASQAGHTVTRFNAAFEEVHPCIGCQRCLETGTCVFRDAMDNLLPQLAEADGIVLVSPIYYYGLTAQLKAVLDRFYSANAALQHNKSAALMVALADTQPGSADGAVRNFQNIAGYMDWKVEGILIAEGCSIRDDLPSTQYPEQAYEMGLNFGRH